MRASLQGNIKRNNVVDVRNQQKKFRIDADLIRKKAEHILILCGVERAELSVLIVNNRRIRELNRRYRGVKRSTDVLAFPLDGEMQKGFRHLGDVVISMEKAASQAHSAGHTPERELFLLLTHGILHLLGHDHERSSAENKRMREMENFILSRI